MSRRRQPEAFPAAGFTSYPCAPKSAAYQPARDAQAHSAEADKTNLGFVICGHVERTFSLQRVTRV